MSNNLGSNSGSGLKVNVRIRCGCNCDAFRIAWTVLCGRPTLRANVRTVQRPCDSGCWQAKVCTFCQTAASYFRGRPERGASRNPSNPRSANDLRHFPTVTGGISRSEAICWLARPAAAAKTIRLRSTSACAVDGACTPLFKVALLFGSRLMTGAIVVTGDFDGDQRSDLVSGLWDCAFLLRGRGDGTFEAADIIG